MEENNYVVLEQAIFGYTKRIDKQPYVNAEVHLEIKSVMDVLNILFAGCNLTYLLTPRTDEQGLDWVELIVVAENTEGTFPIQSEINSLQERCVNVLKGSDELHRIKSMGDIGALARFEAEIGNTRLFEQIEKLRQKRSKPAFSGFTLNNVNMSVDRLNTASDVINLSQETTIETNIDIINLRGLRLELTMEKKKYSISFEQEAHKNLMSCLTRSREVELTFIATQISNCIVRGRLLTIKSSRDTSDQQRNLLIET